MSRAPRQPAEIGPWSPGYRTTRHWFRGSEAARVFHSGSEQTWIWYVWGRTAEGTASGEGRAASKELAQAAADKTLQDEGIILVRPVRAD